VVTSEMSYKASVLHEAVSSAALAYTMNGVAAVAILAQPVLKDLGVEIDTDLLTILLVFLDLSFFFSPVMDRVAKGSVMNPAALLIRWLIGQMSVLKLLVNFCAIIAGSFVGVSLMGLTLQHFPVEGAQIAALVPAAPFWEAARAELGVTVSMSVLHTFLDGVLGTSVLTGALSSGAYCTILAVEQCAYSCSVMNPAAPIALHLYEAGLPGFFSERVWRNLGPYVIGNFGGSIALGIVFMLLSKVAPGAKEDKLKDL